MKERLNSLWWGEFKKWEHHCTGHQRNPQKDPGELHLVKVARVDVNNEATSFIVNANFCLKGKGGEKEEEKKRERGKRERRRRERREREERERREGRGGMGEEERGTEERR